MEKSREIFVSIALGNDTFPVGKLWCYNRKGRESASFEYNKVWLSNPERFALEPALMLTDGKHHTEKALFGSIGDSAPDRWGRILMKRANNTGRRLMELDYLLGVNDFTRQGALRFSENTNEIYLAKSQDHSIPPLVKLQELLYASERFLADNETSEDIKLLLAPGSSLGGARPKASVRDNDGNLFIAKFPRKDDNFNIVRWEAVALELAKIAKINIVDFNMDRGVSGKPILIVKRFDRTNNGGRIPFLSAMSMLGSTDNDDTQHSYLDIAYAIIRYGAYPDRDLEELWRRMVFNILISNTDDHLRNHGFLYERRKGWTLSPAYDLNPNVEKSVFATSIDGTGANNTIDGAMQVSKEFRVPSDRAKKILEEVKAVVFDWEKIARDWCHISDSEIERMRGAFLKSSI